MAGVGGMVGENGDNGTWTTIKNFLNIKGGKTKKERKKYMCIYLSFSLYYYIYIINYGIYIYILFPICTYYSLLCINTYLKQSADIHLIILLDYIVFYKIKLCNLKI